MNEYELFIGVKDEVDVEEYSVIRQATSEALVRRLTERILYDDEYIQSVTLKKRGVVPHDLSSGTSES